MADYVERGAVEKILEEAQIISDAEGEYFGYCTGDISISRIPSADVAQVVRCRDCKHHYWEPEPCHGKSVHYCKLSHMRGVEVFKDFYCYYGERKEGE